MKDKSQLSKRPQLALAKDMEVSESFLGLPSYLQNPELPWMEWIRFKDEECVGIVNIERSLKAKHAMIDISYCMTRALNNCVLYTIKFNQKHFQKSLIG